MLFSYPDAATQDNWVHECLSEMVRKIHTCLQSGAAVPDWPKIIPTPYESRLSTRSGLRDRLNAYQGRVRRLSRTEQTRVLKALADQNQIAQLLSGRSNCDALAGLPQSIHEPILDLFTFAFELLTPLKVRDDYYKIIYAGIPEKLCPFCGYEYFDGPGGPREDLDHYLTRSRYPFAAVNLRNLVPMGQKCNSRYKLDADLLHHADGTRRRAFDPYNTTGVRLSLLNSRPFAGPDGHTPAWQIEFVPDSEEVQTWDEVFHIRERYRRDVLDRCFMPWLRDFGNWCHSAQVRPTNDEIVVEAVGRYFEYQKALKLADRAFLKAAVFGMLQQHLKEGNQRLLSLIKSVMTNP